MVNQQLVRKLVNFEDTIVPTLFKPVQFNILKKLNKGNELTDNEKRYLRGNMREKLKILEELENKEEINDSVTMLLNSIDSYYITGLEALKHNGYGWYFQPKVMEVINTKIKGKLRIAGKAFKFIRIKSIENSAYAMDKETGLKYATNEQIIKDTGITRNEYAKNVWMQMLSRYKKIFAKNYGKFKSSMLKEKTANYEKYGV